MQRSALPSQRSRGGSSVAAWKGERGKNAHMRKKIKPGRFLFFLLLPFYPGQRKARGGSGVGVGWWGERTVQQLCSPSVFVYPGLNVTRQPGSLIQHSCHHNMCHYLGVGHHFTSPLTGVGRGGGG